MSYFDDASLVMIPSGYKDQKVYSVKPIDGSGDLTFSRASNATRVNSSGLVEKVRENLALYSEQFDNGYWNKGAATATADATTAPDGTTTADKIVATATSGNHFIRTTATLTGEFTFSVFAKASEYTNLKLQDINAGLYNCTYDLSSGTASGTGASIQSVGSGWYRCSVTYTSSGSVVSNSLIGAPSTSINYTGDGTSGIFAWGAMLETGVLTDYIATTSSAVSVGPVSGLPRLDYSGGATCPSLLLEPQRTNLLTYSEQFDNATYTQTAMSVTANAAISPDGYQNADKLTPSTTATNHYLTKAATFSGDGVLSVYAKADGYNYLIFLNSSGNVSFNLSNGTASEPTASMVSVGNGWYRCTFPKTFANGTMYLSCGSSSAAAFFNGAGDGTSGVLLYGFQLEAGSYATSLISTQNSAVTRLADSAYKTGISSLIGQTEGTLFVEVNANRTGETQDIELGDGTVDNRVIIRLNADNTFRLICVQASSFALNKTSVATFAQGENLKIAAVYKSSAISQMFVNGVSVLSATAGIITGSFSGIFIGSVGGTLNLINSPVEQLLIFPTALSDAQAIELTTL